MDTPDLNDVLDALASTEGTGKLTNLWMTLPDELEAPFLSAVEERALAAEQGGDAALAASLRGKKEALEAIRAKLKRMTALNTSIQARLRAKGINDAAGMKAALEADEELHRDWQEAGRLEAETLGLAAFEAALEAIPSMDREGQLVLTWSTIPPNREDPFLDALEQRAVEAEGLGNTALADNIRGKLGKLREIRAKLARMAALKASIQERLRAKGVKGPEDITAALDSDAELRRDHEEVLVLKGETLDKATIERALTMLPAAESMKDLDELWRTIPQELEGPFLDAVQERATEAEQAGLVDLAGGLRQRAEALESLRGGEEEGMA